MFVAIRHKIHDPDAYAKRGERIPAEAPEGHELRQFLPSRSTPQAMCLWETEDADELQAFLDDALAGVSTQSYITVDEQQALGLPDPSPASETDIEAGGA